MTTNRDLSQLGKDALNIARKEREAMEDLTEALRECSEAVRELTRELEKIREEEEHEDWKGPAEA